MDVNKELKFLRKLRKLKKNGGGVVGWGGSGREGVVRWGGGCIAGGGGGGQDGCEQRTEVFVKIQKKKFGGGGVGSGGRVGGVRVDVN